MRTFNPDDIRDAVSQIDIPVDVDTWILNPDNVAMKDHKGNVALFAAETIGRTYNGHIFFKTRGKEAAADAKPFLDDIFIKYGASVVLGLTPEDKPHVVRFSLRLGFKDGGTVETHLGPYRILTMARQDWINNE